MTAPPLDAVADLHKLVADLEQRLASSFAAHDAATARAAAKDAENARLRDELANLQERQNASADILRTIASASGDAESGLRQIAEATARLFHGASVAIRIAAGNEWGLSVSFGAGIERITALVPEEQRRPGGRNLPAVVFRENRQIHIPDIDSIDADMADWPVTLARTVGIRTVAGTPLRRDGKAIGALVVQRDRLEPFTADELVLQQSFADQAVIAIENARLFNETKEALERQTATAEVLEVISSSPGDLKPVFDQMLAKAMHLCEAHCGFIYQMEQGSMRAVAEIGVPPAFAEYRRTHLHTGGTATPADVVRATKKPAHVHDARKSEPYLSGNPNAVAGVDLGGARTVLYVPMIRNDEIVGVINVYRKEVKPFADQQIALLENFASQAVIAIENARLFNETKEALERQTAMADILKVIASSPANVQPVFDAIAESAKRLLGSFTAMVTRISDGVVHLAASTAENEAAVGLLPYSLESDRIHARVARTGQVVATDDIEAATHVPPDVKEFARTVGWRSMMVVPMLRHGVAIGTIGITRRETGAFEGKTADLLKTFADQAVIAIENARLFNETKEALEQQTATSEVLEVISSSPGDLQPVFLKMLENATRVCEANFGILNLWDGQKFNFAAEHNIPPGFAAYRQRTPLQPHPGSTLEEVVRTHRVAQVSDLRKSPGYQSGIPQVMRMADVAGARTLMTVPMLKDDELLGVFTIFRQEVRPFTNKQVALVENFSKQAVIAIENTRLLRELRERTDDLSKSLENLRTAQDRLVQTEKLASLGQLTAGIAHEIKNPLNFVNNFSALSIELTEELNDILKPAPLTEQLRKEVNELTGLLNDNLSKVVQHGKRADSIVKNMLLHSREGSGENRSADINALVDESLNLAYHGARAEKPQFNVTLRRDFDPQAGIVEVFPQDITRMLLNLISNGIYAVARRKADADRDGYEPQIIASTRAGEGFVEIRIRDNGTGISPEVMEKIFNPFFTTKPPGEGTGLGLSMVHEIIVKQHGGRIDVETRPQEFTEFIVTLPRSERK
ncbi:two-component system NtrC family sensor kinase [Bradyrhizobium sp. GM24.11]